MSLWLSSSPHTYAKTAPQHTCFSRIRSQQKRTKTEKEKEAHVSVARKEKNNDRPKKMLSSRKILFSTNSSSQSVAITLPLDNDTTTTYCNNLSIGTEINQTEGGRDCMKTTVHTDQFFPVTVSENGKILSRVFWRGSSSSFFCANCSGSDKRYRVISLSVIRVLLFSAPGYCYPTTQRKTHQSNQPTGA